MHRKLTKSVIRTYAEEWLYLPSIDLEDESPNHLYFSAQPKVGVTIEIKVSKKKESYGWGVWIKEVGSRWKFHDYIPTS